MKEDKDESEKESDKAGKRKERELGKKKLKWTNKKVKRRNFIIHGKFRKYITSILSCLLVAFILFPFINHRNTRLCLRIDQWNIHGFLFE